LDLLLATHCGRQGAHLSAERWIPRHDRTGELGCSVGRRASEKPSLLRQGGHIWEKLLRIRLMEHEITSPFALQSRANRGSRKSQGSFQLSSEIYIGTI